MGRKMQKLRKGWSWVEEVVRSNPSWRYWQVKSQLMKLEAPKALSPRGGAAAAVAEVEEEEEEEAVLQPVRKKQALGGGEGGRPKASDAARWREKQQQKENRGAAVGQ